MSWFSREWDGVHMEGCLLYEEDLVSITDWPCNHTHYFRDGESVNEEECSCPELMIEKAVNAAEAYRDRIDDIATEQGV